MIHQPLGGFQGQATDIEIHAKEILKTRDTLNELLAQAHRPAGRPDQERHRARLLHVGAGEAKEYGLIDEVLITAKKKPERRRARQEVG